MFISFKMFHKRSEYSDTVKGRLEPAHVCQDKHTPLYTASGTVLLLFNYWAW